MPPRKGTVAGLAPGSLDLELPLNQASQCGPHKGWHHNCLSSQPPLKLSLTAVEQALLGHGNMQAVRDPALQLVACRVRPGGNLAGAARESPDADPQGFLGGGPRSWTHPSCTEHPATNKHSVREACENDLFGRRKPGEMAVGGKTKQLPMCN